MSITVMGATGRTGKRITEALLRTGETVRALGRSTVRLDELKCLGTEALAGDPTDAEFLTNAFRGADAVYTLLPYDVQQAGYRATQTRLGEAIAQAVRDSGVRHVVFLSSIGADQAEGTGMIEALHEQEERLRAINGINVLFLRAGSFFENFYGALKVIGKEGVNSDAVEPVVAIPMIATRDIAAAAAKALVARDWNGIVVRELLGPRDLSYAEATRIIGEHIDMPTLKYVQVPYAEMAHALMAEGFSDDVAASYVDIARGINEGRIKAHEARNAGNTTATRFEDFAAELAAAFRAL